jgi:hypothetical protein
MQRTLKRYRVVLLVLAATVAGGLIAYGASQKRSPLQQYMRQKLEHAQYALEGLALEDFKLIEKNATAMRKLSDDARWRITPNLDYLRRSAEFQDLAAELAAKAKARNLEGATLAYVQLTINCVNCHKLVRDERLVTLGPRETDRERR